MSKEQYPILKRCSQLHANPGVSIYQGDEKCYPQEDLCQKLGISQEDIVALTEIMVLNFGKSLFTYYVQELVSHGNFSWRFFKPSLQIFAMNDYHPETGDFKVSISMVKL